MSLGPEIKRRREQNGWSLTKLSEKIAISRSYLHELEHDQAQPTVGIVYRLACALGCPMEALLGVRSLTPTVAEINNRAVYDVLLERARQDAKWGEQNHPPEWWLAILGEEFGELATAILRWHFDTCEYEHREADSIRSEAIQVAAVAIALVECLDRMRAREEARA